MNATPPTFATLTSVAAITSLGPLLQPQHYIALRRDIDECELTLDIEPRHVYVVPPLRGQGYGIDLAVTCGGILIDLLNAICCACPPCWALAVAMCSAYPGAADHVFTRHVTALLKRHLRVLRKRGCHCSGDVEQLVGRVDCQ